MPPTFRALGRSGLQVSPIALGCNVFGWTADEAASFSLLDAWIDHGFNLIDTADMYSRWVPGHRGGESETIIGKWLKKSGRRGRVVLATKVGKDMGDGTGSGKAGLHPKYIRKAVDASLQRLRTEYIDLYQSHEDDPAIPMEDVLGTYGDLIDAGKVRAIGASNFSAARLALALQTSERHRLPRYESLQPLYNLYDRAVFEDELEPLCAQHGLGVINFYALAAGFLTGKYRTAADAAKSPRGGWTTAKYLNPRGLHILATLDNVAGRHNATPGQVAIAWQMARSALTAPIASATSMAQLQQLVGAAALQLTPRDIATLDGASQQGRQAD